MKKILLGAMIASVALAASAAEVTSDNVVGYSKIQLPVNAMTIVGNQFQNIGETIINIQDITVAGDFAQDGTDWIKFWDASTGSYQEAYFFGEEADGVFIDDNYEESLGAGWGDADQIVIDLDVNLGQGFWAKSVEGGALVLNGEVSNNNIVNVPVNAMTLIANPIPQAINIQDIKVDENFDTWGGDWIKFWNPSTGTYQEAYFFGEEADGVFADDTYEETLGAGWGDADQLIVDIKIDVGQGFWVKSVNGGSVVFPTVE